MYLNISVKQQLALYNKYITKGDLNSFPLIFLTPHSKKKWCEELFRCVLGFTVNS